MQWAAVCADTRVRRPHYVWTPESDELRLELVAKLQEANRRAREEVERQLATCKVASTPEHHLLLKRQAQRDQENAKRVSRGQKRKLITIKPSQIFKH